MATVAEPQSHFLSLPFYVSCGYCAVSFIYEVLVFHTSNWVIIKNHIGQRTVKGCARVEKYPGIRKQLTKPNH